MPEYATITVQVTEHGDDLVGVDAELSARPLTEGSMLSYPAEPERLSVGTWTAGPNSDGSIAIQIPTDTLQDPVWRFDLRLKGGSQPVNIPLGTYQIAESAALTDLVNIDVTSVSPDLVESVAQYAADAQAAADAAAAFGTTNDTVIAGRINDGTSATSAALADTIATELETPGAPARAAADARYVVRTDSIAALPEPAYFAHRMGCGVGPELTMETARLAVAGGADGLEMDLQPLIDALGTMHDATVDRTTNATGNVEDFTSLGWRKINAADYAPWTGMNLPPALFTEVLGEFAGRITLMVEPKDVSNAEQLMDVADAFGLQNSIVIATKATAAMTACVARGYSVYFYWTVEPSTAAIATAVTGGAAFLGCDGLTLSDAKITELVATGVPVVPFTVNRRVTHDHLLALGVKGFLTDQPVYLKRTTAFSKVDSWRYGTLGHGFINYNNTTGPPNVQIDAADGSISLITASNTVAHVVGEVSPVANAAGSYSLAHQVAVPTIPASGTAAVFVAFGMADDSVFNNLTGFRRTGYQAYMTVGGSLRLYKNTDASTVVQLGVNVATAPMVVNTYASLKPYKTATTVGVVRTDSPVATLSAGLASGAPVTSLPINALAIALISGAQVMLPTGQVATLTAATSAGATSLTVSSITPSAAVASAAPLLGTIQATDSTYNGGYVHIGKFNCIDSAVKFKGLTVGA